MHEALIVSRQTLFIEEKSHYMECPVSHCQYTTHKPERMEQHRKKTKHGMQKKAKAYKGHLSSVKKGKKK